MTDTRAETAPESDKPGLDRRLLAPMMLGSVLNPINSTIISVALIPIGRALGAPSSQTAWLVSALYLATSLGQPVVGRLIDIFGPRRLFLLSTGLVGVAGVVGTLAPGLGVLIVARILLGFGTCAGYPAAMALLRSEAERTGKDNPGGVLTALAVSNQTIAVVGPLLGGLLIAVGGWRATFALNVPLAVAAVLMGLLRLPRPARTGESSRRGRLATRLDLPGMGLFAATLTSLLLFLMNPHPRDWYLLVIAVAAGAAFAARELRAAVPFIDLRVLGGNTPLLATYGRALVTYVVSYAFLYGFSQWTEEGYGLTPFRAGLVQVPMFLLAIGASVVSGRRKGVRGKLLIGAAGQIAACLLMLALTGRSPLWMLLLVALIFGVPQGLNSLALQNSVYFQADPGRTASSAGLLRTFAYIGSMVASSATATSFGQRADTGGMHQLAWVMLGAGVLYLLLTLLDRTLGRGATEEASAAT
ncbi:MFS transporter [Streptomyces tsukubensis]|uniref:MFS transporter n=1 Tax=Streptomyces tsukubensis TaxID=83656 RepID=A0A1V4AG81_9ACTN|nr:MFS transporter [Streptomyces tsukubensis]OON83034.1 MFS transporter [Streptomyces tsukubensis]QFR91971.1 MFS transporter [Streptomyces tsukubensis]